MGKEQDRIILFFLWFKKGVEMKKILFETNLSKAYILIVGLFCIILLGSYFSYAMFTVSKEKSNAISIVTGNLTYDLKVDGINTDKLVVPAKSSKEFIVTLTNSNNRTARFNFYYLNNPSEAVFVGYISSDEYNIPMKKEGINLEKTNTLGSTQSYKIKVANHSNQDQTITLGVEVGLDYNDLTLPSNGCLFKEITTTVADILHYDTFNNIISDAKDTNFITGKNPNNYIWYSGKLWQAVSIDLNDYSVKLVSAWNISAIPYNSGNNNTFEGSYLEAWLNDTSVDGFLGTLRKPESFIKMDSKWNAKETTGTTPPTSPTLVTDPVGLLNVYEYTMSYNGTTPSNGYLNNGLYWWLLTPSDNYQNINYVTYTGEVGSASGIAARGIRPTVNLKPNIKIVAGMGTKEDPYRLEGDYDINLSGTLLNTRYSGEYLAFGTGENNLYRIVSHETAGLTKITSAEPLKDAKVFKVSDFGNTVTFSNDNIIGTFLNNEYLTNGIYLTSTQVNKIADNSSWYTANMEDGADYRLAKYTDTNMTTTITSITAKVGLLRLGELMAGQFETYNNNATYWLINSYNSSNVRRVSNYGYADNGGSLASYSIKPALNLKSNVIITGGEH